MGLSSPIFLGCFLPILLGLYALAPRRARSVLLLAASLFFYAWGDPKGILVLVGLLVANHALGRAADGHRGETVARLAAASGIVLDLGALVAFKYTGLFADSANRLLGLGLPVPRLWLPLGLSFFTFQLVSYLVDVRRHTVPAERSLFAFALYVAFFPKLLAGPIVRYETIRSDLADRSLRADDAAEGLRRFARGLAKKVLLADSLAGLANAAYPADPSALPCLFAWAGTLCYALQLFYDFSGYSDMAIGLARIFGFRFPENFDHPYAASSLREFWHRWHITLSTWFRDYLYFPLGGSRRGALRTYANQFIVFGLCGLWHGASWCFLVWGLWHGLGLTAERIARSLRKTPATDAAPSLPRRILGNLALWLFLLVGWVPFSAGSRGYGLAYAKTYLGILFTGNPGHPLQPYLPALDSYTHSVALALVVGLLLAYPIVRPAAPDRKPGAWAYAGSFALLTVAFAFAMTSRATTFIYAAF